jgi:hypothetical protein
MMSQTLYQYKNEEISIHIEAYFENGNLIVSGYDIGKRVKEYFGDSDYEYTTTVHAPEVGKLFALLNVEENEEALLQALAMKFNTNSCYSAFQTFLGDNKIKYEGFSWM